MIGRGEKKKRADRPAPSSRTDARRPTKGAGPHHSERGADLHDHHAPADAVALTELRVGETGEIVRVISKNRSRTARLGAYGVVAGSQVQLLQKAPAFVIRLGETELGLDDDLARDILVSRKGRGHRKEGKSGPRAG